MKRVQVRDLTQPQLRPQARPVDTFITPGGVNPAQGGAALAEALRGVTPQITRALEARDQRRGQEAERSAEARLAQMSTAEILEARKRGDLSATSDAYEQRALDMGIAYRLARHQEDDLMRRLSGESTAGEGIPSNAIDPLSTDVDTVFADTIEQSLQEYGFSPESTAAQAYVQGMEKARGRFLDVQAKARAEESQKVKLDAAFEAFNEVLQVSREQGWDADQTQTAIQNQLADNARLFGLSNETQNDQLLQIADQLAGQGNYELVEKLLLGTRKTAKGDSIPGLGLTGRYASATEKLLDKARSHAAQNLSSAQFDASVRFGDMAQQGRLNEKELKAWRAENPYAISDSQARSLILQSRNAAERAREKLSSIRQTRQMQLDAQMSQANANAGLLGMMDEGTIQMADQLSFIDEKGREKVLTPKQLQERGTEMYLNDISPRIAHARGETPEQVLIREVEYLSKNGLPHPKAARVMQSGPASLTMRGVTGTEDLPQNIQKGFEMYSQIKALNPGYLRSIVKDDRTRDFYERMLTAKEYLGAETDQEAAMIAYNATYGEASGESVVNAKDIDSAVANLKTSKESWFTFGDRPMRNEGILNARVKKVAKEYKRLGLSDADAVSKAYDDVESSVIEINGWAVPSNGFIPPEAFKEVATKRIQQVADAEGIDADDLTLTRVGSAPNVWIVVYGANPAAKATRGALGTFTTQSMLKDHHEATQQERQKLVIEKSAEFKANDERNKAVADKVLNSEGSNAL